jgi:sterol desaturase/sphingolipid hydroxylase (fatty acid hydroxylase superfamily)
MQMLKGYRLGMWSKSHNLSKMTFRELVVAYFQYYAIQAYLLLTVASLYVAWAYPTTLLRGAASAAIAIAAYPLAWFLLHRYVLHSNWMFKSPLTARTWKRIHYDHHQDPNHLEVLFGALYTTLPTIAIVTIPVGYAIGGIGGAAWGFGAGLLTTCFYEFCHCIQHLSYKPRSPWLVEMKTRHMEHHFHDEDGNFGITNFMWDKLFGTYYQRGERPEKSETVFNLGYTTEAAEKWPWVASMSGGVAEGHPRQRMKKAA